MQDTPECRAKSKLLKISDTFLSFHFIFVEILLCLLQILALFFFFFCRFCAFQLCFQEAACDFFWSRKSFWEWCLRTVAIEKPASLLPIHLLSAITLSSLRLFFRHLSVLFSTLTFWIDCSLRSFIHSAFPSSSCPGSTAALSAGSRRSWLFDKVTVQSVWKIWGLERRLQRVWVPLRLFANPPSGAEGMTVAAMDPSRYLPLRPDRRQLSISHREDDRGRHESSRYSPRRPASHPFGAEMTTVAQTFKRTNRDKVFL